MEKSNSLACFQWLSQLASLYSHGLRSRLTSGSDGCRNGEISCWFTGSQCFSSPSMRLLWKFQFLQIHCSNSLRAKRRDTRVSLEYFHFCQESHAGKRKKLRPWCHPGDFVSWKETYTILTAFPGHLRREWSPGDDDDDGGNHTLTRFCGCGSLTFYRYLVALSLVHTPSYSVSPASRLYHPPLFFHLLFSLVRDVQQVWQQTMNNVFFPSSAKMW